MTAAIVIARGGSVRLPRKNVLPFCGLPLVAWSIVQARCSHLVDRVYLTTDDDEIAGIGEEYGAEVIRRPDWPDAALASGGRPMSHAIRTILSSRDDCDLIVATMPTTPCRFPDDIDKTINVWRDIGRRDVYILSVARRRETDLMIRVTSYLVEVAIEDNLGLYYERTIENGVCTPQLYLQQTDAPDLDSDRGNSVHKNPTFGYCETMRFQTVNVDTAEEFELAEIMMEHYILKGAGPRVYHDYGRTY